jgi:multicomponent Na+:H+ antiporter subunit D
VGAFSVVGVPPFAGFVGKLAVFRTSVEAGSVFLTAMIFLGSALSFVYAFQIYQRVFWAPNREGEKSSPLPIRVLVLFLAGLVLAAGLWPEPLLTLGAAAGGVLEGPP